MDRFHKNNKIILPLRGVAALFSLIELGLAAYGVSVFDKTYYYDDGFGDTYSYTYNFGSLNFILFAALWTLLLLIYLGVSIRMPHIQHIFATVALLAVTMIFWFAGFISLAVFLGSTIDGFCSSGIGPCGVLDAITAFAAFLWVIFVVDTVFAAMAAFGSTRNQNPNPMGTQMTAA